MRMTFRASVLLVLLSTYPLAAQDRQPGAGELMDLQAKVQQVIQQTEPSVVCILVSRSNAYTAYGAAPSTIPGKLGSFNSQNLLHGLSPDNVRERQKILSLDLSHPDTIPESYGSGVILPSKDKDEPGLILTNAHVVSKATKLFVRLAGGQGSWADIHALDPRSDLAVLKLQRLPQQALKPIKIGDGSKIRKGAFVVALANPFAAGFRDGSASASFGIVSNVRRRAPGLTNDIDRSRSNIHHFGSLIQTDVRLHLGCSGGALLNLQGEMIGMTTAIAALSGGETPGGFAVPMDVGIHRIIDVLSQGEEVEYGFLGVRLNMEKDSLIPGVPLAEVPAGGPAALAGIHSNDVIVAVNGIPVNENDDLFLFVGTMLAGNTVRIDVAGQRQPHQVTLAKFAVPGTPIASHRPEPRMGLRVDYASVLAQHTRTIPQGVVIRSVVSDSPAERARLRPDMVIVRVNSKPVFNPKEFYSEMDLSRGAPTDITYRNSDGREEHVVLNPQNR
jgi:S1-C subfamily serine protease